MRELKDVDLSTANDATLFVKNETVEVVFATADSELTSREGTNRYAAGDALITATDGSRWSVSRNRFDAKYDPVAPVTAGENGAYPSKPVAVFARQMREPFTISRSAGGDVLRGLAQDWLLQYAPGDHGIIANTRFLQVYRAVKN